MPNFGNDVVRQRILARGGVTSPLGDYVAMLPNRILTTRGTDAQGPVTAPTIAPTPSNAPDDLLRQIRDLLARMPVALSDEFRTRFIMQPRESVSFIVPGENAALAAGAAAVIAAFQMNEGFTGFLTAIGVNVAPAGAFANIVWQLRVNGSIHPNFSNRVFAATSISTPIPFAFELMQSRQVQLVAVNNGPGALDVSGVLVGWTEYMADYKRYGSSPSSGIA